MSDEDTTLNIRGLEQVLKALKGKQPICRVGVLGGKARDSKGGNATKTNAEIGAAHEFGTEVLPQRSFLRVPISDNLDKAMENSGALDKKVLDEIIKSGSVAPWLKKIAALAEGIVLEAFATGGFGKWKPSDMTYKKNAQTLVETHQLRDSITSEVKV